MLEKKFNLLFSEEINPSLARIKFYLKKLGNPHQALKFIHISGTNGKGSTAQFLTFILKEAHFKVGTFTSPHPDELRHGIRINNKPISERLFKEFSRKILTQLDSEKPLTQFEFLTLLAFAYFTAQKVDIGIIEVGLETKWDATNVSRPLVTVITNIEIEHSHFLGKNLLEVAKSQINLIKPRSTVVASPMRKRIKSLLVKFCHKQKAPLYLLGRDFFYERGNPTLKSERFNINIKGEESISYLETSLLGEHQVINAVTAITATWILKKFGFGVSPLAIKRGIRKTTWPMRFEILSQQPFIILDGAHNPAAFQMLRKTFQERWPDKKVKFILGILEDKDALKIMKIIAPLSQLVIITSPQSKRAANLEKLLQIAQKYGVVSQSAFNVKEAIEKVLATLQKEDIICITGSLYTTSEARRFLKIFKKWKQIYLNTCSRKRKRAF